MHYHFVYYYHYYYYGLGLYVLLYCDGTHFALYQELFSSISHSSKTSLLASRIKHTVINIE